MCEEQAPLDKVTNPWNLIAFLIQRPKGLLRFFFRLFGIAFSVAALAAAVLYWKGIDPFVLVQSHIKVPQVGIVNYARSSDQLDGYKWEQLRTHATKEIYFIGVALHHTLGSDHINDVRNNLQRGVSHRFLIADPTGKHFASNCAMFAGTDLNHKENIIDTVRGYLELKKELDTHKDKRNGSIELRIIDEPFPQAAYFFNPSETDARLILVSRLPRVGAPSMPAMVFGKATDGLLNAFYTEWNLIWGQATPYEEWVADKPDFATQFTN